MKTNVACHSCVSHDEVSQTLRERNDRCNRQDKPFSTTWSIENIDTVLSLLRQGSALWSGRAAGVDTVLFLYLGFVPSCRAVCEAPICPELPGQSFILRPAFPFIQAQISFPGTEPREADSVIMVGCGTSAHGIAQDFAATKRKHPHDSRNGCRNDKFDERQ